MEMKMEESKKRIYLFLKFAIITFIVGLIINCIIILFFEKSDIKNIQSVINSNFVIPYVIFIVFKFYEIFINRERK